MKTSFRVVSVLTLSAFCSFATDWPQWGGRPTRNMYSPARGLPDQFGKIEFKSGTEEVDKAAVKNLKWIAKLGAQSYGNVTVAAQQGILDLLSAAGKLS